ncbi:MAG: hypothetical protein JW712_02785 [Dehalococcoidales bacterium]|nr:hypothetical protein [Dehalococcoidales bacterium]
MKEIEKRTLYECSNARVKGDRIYCAKGHRFLSKSQDGGVGIGRLASGKQLAFQVCQSCPDFDEMGPPVPVKERGWLNDGR